MDSGAWKYNTLIGWLTGTGGTAASGAAFLCNAWATGSGGAFPASMGKLMLATAWYSQLSGDATNDKIGEVEADLRWREQTDQTTTTVPSATVDNHTTYLGLVFAGTVTTINGYAVLISRTGGAAPVTTLRLVKIDTGSTFATPTFTDLGPAAVTVPNATNGDVWRVKARLRFAAPSFTTMDMTVTLEHSNGVTYSMAPGGQQIPQGYGLNTGQGSPTSWATPNLYAGFLNRPGWRRGIMSTPAGGIAVPNQWESLRIRDVGPIVNAGMMQPAYSLTAAPTLAVASVGGEANTGAGGTLTVMPSWTQETTDGWAVSEFVSDSGDLVRFPRQTVRRRLWSFHWDALDSSEYAALRALESASYGRFGRISWTDPETALAVYVRFTSPVEYAKVGPDTWTASATVEAVL